MMQKLSILQKRSEWLVGGKGQQDWGWGSGGKEFDWIKSAQLKKDIYNLLIKNMAYLVAKLLIAIVIVGQVAALQAHDQALPNDGLGTYKPQSCCPDGYFVAG